MTKPDPLAHALDALTGPPPTGGVKHLIERLYGNRPDVLASILAARTRGQSYRQIAAALSAEHPISEGAVANWCEKQGVA